MHWFPLVLMVLLFFTGMPIVLAIGFCSLLYAVFVADVPLLILPQQVISAVDTFLLLAVPMFILAGSLMGVTDVTTRLVRFSQALVGWLRGGLAQVNVLTNMFMAGISGSGLADAAATGSTLIPVMKKAGYGAGFAAAVTGCASCIGPIIPPSIIMVVIGGMTSISVGRMFLGGVLPGVVLGVLFGLVSYVVSRRRDYPVAGRFDVRELLRAFGAALPSMSVPAVVIGGILFGVFTPTESAGVAVLIVILLGLLYRKLTWRAFYRAVVDTGVMTGTVLFVVGVSAILGWCLIAENTGDLIAESLRKVTTDPSVMMLLMVAVLVALGCIMEVLAALILTVPVLFPVAQSIGIDPVYFGVIATIALTSGLVTPPFGLTMFLMADMAGVSIEEFSREALPFIVCLFAGLLLFIFIPGFVLWLPNVMMGKN